MTTRAQFTEKYYKDARRVVQGTNLTPWLVLSVAALESNNGDSLLSSKYNNFFGVKDSTADNWTGKYVTMDTTEANLGRVKAKFRVYESPKQSFSGFVQFLKENPRYSKAGLFKAKTTFEQFQALKNAGYATAPNYVQVLKNTYAQLNPAMKDSAAAQTAGISTPLAILSALLLINYLK